MNMASAQAGKQLTGVVVSAGKMIKTVKVRIANREWNKKIQKYYAAPKTLLASDPTSSTREGDIVILEGGRRTSRQVRHTIAGIVSPMGPPLSQRPAILSPEERAATFEAKRAAKDIRQAVRGRYPAIERLQERIDADSSFVVDADIPLLRKRIGESAAEVVEVLETVSTEEFIPITPEIVAMPEIQEVPEQSELELKADMVENTTIETQQMEEHDVGNAKKDKAGVASEHVVDGKEEANSESEQIEPSTEKKKGGWMGLFGR